MKQLATFRRFGYDFLRVSDVLHFDAELEHVSMRDYSQNRDWYAVYGKDSEQFV